MKCYGNTLAETQEIAGSNPVVYIVLYFFTTTRRYSKWQNIRSTRMQILK